LLDDSGSDIVEAVDDHGTILQVDGVTIPDSATPDTTPEKDSAPEELPATVTGTRPKVRLDPSEYLSCTSDSDDASNVLDDALHTTPEWDNYGTDLECSVGEIPISYRSVPLDQAVNLILPLTSTPIPSTTPGSSSRGPRVSAPRRQLPYEQDRKESSFLSRLNPFRKKT
jgi:hypothetical protein